MANSIIQKAKECFVTGDVNFLDKHHIMNGPYRKKSERYGLWIWLRHDWHVGTVYAVHNEPKLARRLKEIAQIIFERKYGHELWMKEFHKNYIRGEVVDDEQDELEDD